MAYLQPSMGCGPRDFAIEIYPLTYHVLARASAIKPLSPDSEQHLTVLATASSEGMRVDKALAELLPGYSRSAIQQWLKQSRVRHAGKSLKPSDRLRGNEQLDIAVPAVQPAEWLAQAMDIEVLYRDDDLLVLNKPAGLVVHPGAGNPDGTLLNGLLYLDDGLRCLPRAGIVHRLDKDTSGLMVVARSEYARQRLVEQLKEHSVKRRYMAVVNGIPITGETIDQPIGRHHHDRLRMAVRDCGKPAVTHTRILEKFRVHSLLQADLETGRTHQIRVHLAWRGYALVGDPLYGGRVKLPPAAGADVIEILRNFHRQALHARQLCLAHPRSGNALNWECDAPHDMQMLIDALRKDAEIHGQ